MPNKQGHRRFGNVRKLPSGRYQVRYPGPDGRLRGHPQTFDRKGDAERALSLIEAQMIAGDWTRNAARPGSAITPATGSHNGPACAYALLTSTAGYSPSTLTPTSATCPLEG